MTKSELELIENIDRIKEKPICAEDLKPFMKDRTLLYGYTCARETFHVYLKNMQIHVVIYSNDYNDDKIKPINMREVIITSQTVDKVALA